MTETLVRYEDPAPGVARIVLARAEAMDQFAQLALRMAGTRT
jgi:hypothetical protein